MNSWSASIEGCTTWTFSPRNEPDDALLARYLMGVCSEDEKARIEEHLFARDEVFERLCAVEEELIGRRLREELTREDRDQFDRAYGAPPRRDRVLFARALSSVLSEEASKEAEVSWWSAFWRTSGFPLAFAAASVVLVAGVAFLSWRASELRSSLASIQAENDTLRQQRNGDRQRLAELEKRAATLNDELNRERAGRPAGGEPRPSGLIATSCFRRGSCGALVSPREWSCARPLRMFGCSSISSQASMPVASEQSFATPSRACSGARTVFARRRSTAARPSSSPSLLRFSKRVSTS